MGHGALLGDLVVVMGVAVVLVYLLNRLRVPAIVGFLVAGVLIGPHALGLVESQESIDTMAEIGVILLLFTVGLEFSLRDLLKMKGLVFGAGVLQVGGIIAIVTVGGMRMGLAWQPSLLFGFLLALSSTAVVFRLLQERGESQAPQGRLMVGLLIFQDLAVIPMLLVLPFFQQGEEISWVPLAMEVGRSLLIVAGILLASRLVLPPLFEAVVKSRSPEVFTLTTVAVALGVAYVAGLFGISLELGAFLAGIVVSESVYSHQIMSEIAPLRDAFSSLFFVSVGMLLNPAAWMSDPLMSIGIVVAVLILKAVVVGGVALAFGFGPRVGTLAGLGLAQVGEFSFIIANQALDLGLMNDALYGQFISVSVITMGLTPFFMMLSPYLAARAQDIGWLRDKLGPYARAVTERSIEQMPQDHVIVVGYGVSGRNVVRVLEQLDVERVIVELNPFVVRELLENGEHAQYGDACRMQVLERAGIRRARAIVVTVPDPTSVRRIVANAGQANPNASMLVRTRLVSEVERLHDLGADAVVPEEFETSLQLAGLVMEAYGASEHAVEREKDLIRQDNYHLLCKPDAPCPVRPTLSAMLSAVDFEEVEIAEDSPAAGKTIREFNLRANSGASISAVGRGEEVFGNPPADFTLQAGDRVFIYGSGEELAQAREYIEQAEAK